MKWYLVKIVFRIICGDGDHKAQFDEQIRLITAPDSLAAFYKAQEMGEIEQENFVNHENQIVQWKFVNVAELYQLREMIDGAELFSRIEESEDADSYINLVQNKAQHTKERYQQKLLEHL